MASLKRKKRKLFNEINITPLTDIFLVLLIIMMVVAPMLDQQGLTLSVPTAQEAQEQIDKESHIITIDVNAKGEYFINETLLSDFDLKQTLIDNSQEENNGLLIRANADSTHGAVVKLMDLARTAGIFSISLVEK